MSHTTTAQSRTEFHAIGEPEELFGKFGEPRTRGVYAYTAPSGDELWVAVSSAGRVVASVPIPPVPQRDPDGLAMQTWQHSLGRAWIALEVLDPCDDARVASYPDFMLTT